MLISGLARSVVSLFSSSGAFEISLGCARADCKVPIIYFGMHLHHAANTIPDV